ncbi:MAG: DNA polymerase III subunit gamma/tau [bacterium]|nr:DNA polymerase III subunit gamma/tau [bacterium]
MGEVLYRKYRSRSLDEVVGQEHITATLKNALKTDQISHAYLFTGPKGVGKTSIARILAREVNGLPYSEDQHLDIIEIDAASNRRIDEIRDLRDKVHITPTSSKYKVYIIDEVHMLTKEAFNALLKTLEEPPDHVIFILATTDFHKLPDTIVSRTQRYTFKPISKQKVVDHLRELATKENIEVDDEALEIIAEHGEGSFRDSIGLLDSMKAGGEKVTLDLVKQSLGVPSENSINSIIDNVETGNLTGLSADLDALITNGYQATEIAKLLIEKAHFVATETKKSPLDYKFLGDLVKIGSTFDPTKALEIILIAATLKNANPKQIEPVVSEKIQEPKELITDEKKHTEPVKETSEEIIQKIEPGSPELWQEVLKMLKGKHNTLYGVARMGDATIEGNELTLVFSFPFHQRRCNEQNNKQKIQDTIKSLTGKDYIVNCVLSDIPKKTETIQAKPKNDDKLLNNVKDIFGGGEVI